MAGLACVACVESERTIQGKTTVEQRYFLTSLTPPSAGSRSVAKQVLRAVRSHWGIENQQHWLLNVAFREGASRVQRDNAPANLATLRRLALALVTQEKTTKASKRTKRLKAGWDNDYLLTLLAGQT
jgi:predicted transposase YbfD/YdcC